MLKTRDIHDVEILSVGLWNGTGCPPKGCEFTTDDLDELVATYEATKDHHQAPLKLGHDDNQALLQADGYPAAGWLSNVRREGEKLLASLLKVPEKIADLMEAGAYRQRSVELDEIDVDGKQRIGLMGMALLGADLPAVKNLGDILGWYSAQKVDLAPTARAVMFSAPETPARTLMTYVDNAEQVLTDLQAFAVRTGELVALRAKDGRQISEKHQERITSLRDGLRDVATTLESFVEQPTPPEPDPPNYGPVMQTRARLASLRMTDLTGVTT